MVTMVMVSTQVLGTQSQVGFLWFSKSLMKTLLVAGHFLLRRESLPALGHGADEGVAGQVVLLLSFHLPGVLLLLVGPQLLRGPELLLQPVGLAVETGVLLLPGLDPLLPLVDYLLVVD